jgi:hypothetical protein
VKVALTAGLLAVALLTSGCGKGSSIGFNASCTSDCFTIKVRPNESQADIDTAMQQACAKFGRHGSPQILEKSPDQIGGTCPQ